MFAVVQIGSKARRSPCITARIVLPAAGCARSTEGAWVSAAAAAVVCRNVRRVAFMASSPWRGVRMPLAGIGAIEARDALRGKRRLPKGARALAAREEDSGRAGVRHRSRGPCRPEPWERVEGCAGRDALDPNLDGSPSASRARWLHRRQGTGVG